jgi:hypothetical protein
VRSAVPRLSGAGVVTLASLSLVAPLLVGAPASATPGTTPHDRGEPVAAATGPVRPEVREVPVDEIDRPGNRALVAMSRPQPVSGYGVVGATWRGAPPEGLRLSVRTRTAGEWSSWQRLHGGSCPDPACAAARPAAAQEYAGHGPDAGSAEADGSRAGTDPFGVGRVDAVQLRALSADGRVPDDLELSVVDPGESLVEENAGAARASEASTSVQTSVPGVAAPRPNIRSRRAWGADPRLRSGSPRYGRVRAGFVHHTVNTNRYSRGDVPAIIRGIYAYHTQSLGWSDIGYNFLVDRFGRKWVGRSGGWRRRVIGAHTYGYNHLSTGMAAIGSFQKHRPPVPMLRALGRMMGWKLGLHGVRAGDRSRWLEGRRFRAISAHRDAGETLCPGRKLSRRLRYIRRVAIHWQHR